MKQVRLLVVSFWVVVVLAFFSTMPAHAGAGAALKIDVQLIWGSNQTNSPDPKHKPVDADLASRLSKSLFKWKHYFEVQRQQVSIPAGQTRQAKMSDHCVLDIKNLGNGRVEVKLQGDGKPVSTQVETLADDWPLILAGDAKNDTAWLVVIQKIPDKAPPK